VNYSTVYTLELPDLGHRSLTGKRLPPTRVDFHLSLWYNRSISRRPLIDLAVSL